MNTLGEVTTGRGAPRTKNGVCVCVCVCVRARAGQKRKIAHGNQLPPKLCVRARTTLVANAVHDLGGIEKSGARSQRPRTHNLCELMVARQP